MALPWTITQTTEKEEEEKPLSPTQVGQIAEELGYPVIKPVPPKEEVKDTWLKRIARIVLPRSLEIKLGITEPNEWDLAMEREDARLSYLREKKFKELYQKEIVKNPEVPKDYKEPTSFTGQLLEGFKEGVISTKAGFGAFVETLGRRIASPEMAEWGMEVGDRATIELIKRKDLLEPEDLKPFFEDGLLDRRWWGR